MKALLVLFVMLFAVSGRADTFLSRLDCQASNGVTISTSRPLFSKSEPVIVNAKWFDMGQRFFEARLVDNTIMLLGEDEFKISLPLNLTRTSAQNLTGSLESKSGFVLAWVYCTVELEKLK